MGLRHRYLVHWWTVANVSVCREAPNSSGSLSTGLSKSFQTTVSGSQCHELVNCCKRFCLSGENVSHYNFVFFEVVPDGESS